MIPKDNKIKPRKIRPLDRWKKANGKIKNRPMIRKKASTVLLRRSSNPLSHPSVKEESVSHILWAILFMGFIINSIWHCLLGLNPVPEVQAGRAGIIRPYIDGYNLWVMNAMG